MPDIPTTAAANMVKAVDRITEAFGVWMVQNYNLDAATAAQTVEFINQLPLEAMITDTFGFNNDLAALEASQIQILQNFEAVAPITPGTVQALINVNQATFMQYVPHMASTLKSEMVKATLAGVPRNKLVNHLKEAAGKSLSRGQIKTLVETAMKTFSRSVNAVMTEDMPEDTLFQYIGVSDGKTRPICLAMLAAGAMTREEIDERFPGAFLDGGGFNCRHRFAVKTELSDKFSDQSDATARLAAQGINPAEVPTFQQTAGG